MRRAIVLLLLSSSLGGCEEEVIVAPPSPVAAKAVNPAAVRAVTADAGTSALPDFSEDVFAEADVQRRDPFRSYARSFKVEVPKVVQRQVLLSDVSIDQMRLIAIVTGGIEPRAMIVDPMGIGHVVKRGDFVGRSEVVQAGGEEGIPVTLNWRVDRIRPNELVLTREDPTSPNQVPLSRVIPLREEGDQNVLQIR